MDKKCKKVMGNKMQIIVLRDFRPKQFDKGVGPEIYFKNLIFSSVCTTKSSIILAKILRNWSTGSKVMTK